MADLKRIKENVAKMAGVNAPEEDIDGYIASEGVTVEEVRNFDISTPQGEDAGAGAAFGEALANVVPGGQKITSGLAAGALSLAGQGNYWDLFNQAQANTKATAEAHPVASLAGTVTGILPTLGLGVGAAKWAAKPISAGAGLAPQAINLLGRSAKGAAISAPLGGAYFAGESEKVSDMPQDFASGAKFAGALGALTPLAAAGVGAAIKAIAPRVNEGLREVGNLAMKYKIPLSFDQISDSNALKTAQKVSQEIPFSGQAAMRDAQVSAWNKALLKTVGAKGDKFTPLAMDKAFTEVGMEFDKMTKGKVFQFDDAFSRRLDDIRQEAKSTSTKDAIENFENEVANLLKNADASGAISGEKLSFVRAKINKLARKSNNPDTKDLLHDLEISIIDTMTGGDETAQAAFKATKQKYKNLIVIEPLANKAKGGKFSPTLLQDRVSKVYGRQFTRGDAGEIGDLARIGYELLPELGGSDTMQKTALTSAVWGGASGAAWIDPVTTSTILGANRLLQSGLNRNQGLIKKALTPKE